MLVGVVSLAVIGCTTRARSGVESAEVFCPTEKQEALEAYNRANDLDRQGKFEEAKDLYLKAIEADPSYCDAMDNLGLLLRRQGKLDEAISWYRRSIEVFPENRVAHQNLAVAYRRLGKTDEAMVEYRTLIELHPEDPEGHFGLGSIYLDLNEPEAAIPHLRKAEEIYIETKSPYLPDAQYLLGLAHYRLSAWGRAREYFEQAYPTLQNQADINFYLGMCYRSEELGNPKLARQYLNKARELGKRIPPEVLQDLEG